MLLENWYEVTFTCKVMEFGKLRMEVKAASEHEAYQKANIMVPNYWVPSCTRELKPEEIPNG